MKSILKYIILPLLFTSCIGCENKEHDTPAPEPNGRELSKYEPEDGKCFVFIGQDLGAVDWNSTMKVIAIISRLRQE